MLIRWLDSAKEPEVYWPVGGVSSTVSLLVIVYCCVKCYLKHSPSHRFRRETDQLMTMSRLLRGQQ